MSLHSSPSVFDSFMDAYFSTKKVFPWFEMEFEAEIVLNKIAITDLVNGRRIEIGSP